MKKSFKKTFLGFMIAPLLLSACKPMDKAVDVAYNLDYLYQNNIENAYFPSEISSSDTLEMLETKQDFILYLYQDHCATCTELASPKMKKFLSNKDTMFKIYALDAETKEIEILSKNEKYGSLFDVTPKVMFFKNGEHYMTLSDKRYTNQKLFDKAMKDFCRKTSIYTASLPIAIENFLNSNDQYVLYFLSSLTVNKNPSKIASLTFYKNNIFDLMKYKNTKTLVIEDFNLPLQYKNELYAKLNLDSSVNTWGIIKNSTQFISYNYNEANSAKIFIDNLNKLD